MDKKKKKKKKKRKRKKKKKKRKKKEKKRKKKKKIKQKSLDFPQSSMHNPSTHNQQPVSLSSPFPSHDQYYSGEKM